MFQISRYSRRANKNPISDEFYHTESDKEVVTQIQKFSKLLNTQQEGVKKSTPGIVYKSFEQLVNNTTTDEASVIVIIYDNPLKTNKINTLF